MKITAILIFSLILSGCMVQSPENNGNQAIDLETRLGGLSFDDFLETSYNILLVRTPELITELGLDTAFKMRGDRLNDISETYLLETEWIEREIRSMLEQYPPESLSETQLFSRKIYKWFLDDSIEGQRFRHHRYTVSHFITAEQIQTELFFTDIQPVTNINEAENYITRLNGVKRKMEQAADGLQLRSEKGIVLPEILYSETLRTFQNTVYSRPGSTSFYSVFKEKLARLNLPADKEKDLLLRAETACAKSVIPGYKTLQRKLIKLRPQAPTDEGVWQLPDGKEYYQYVLKHYTTSPLSPEEIHNTGLTELSRIHQEMKTLFVELEYDTENDVSMLYRRLDRSGKMIPGGKMVDTYYSIIDHAEALVSSSFNRLPQAEIAVKGVPSGGFYIPGAVDGSRPGVFYATTGGSRPFHEMQTLAFHETIPGHHLQISLAQESDLPSFHKGSRFTGYTEGWALYAEGLMRELGYYDDDPMGELGALRAEAFRAARLVVDTGIHYYKWNFNKALNFFSDNTGYSDGFSGYQIMRYIVFPGQAASYMTGFLSLLKIRDQYKNKMKDQFSMKDFHSFILDQGAVPLEILEQIVQN